MSQNKTVRWIILVMCLMAVVQLTASESQAEQPEQQRTLSNRDKMALRMVQLAQAGRITDSREVLREYLQTNTGDGPMFYNLACLDLVLQEKEQALADLEKALKNGYTNFRLMEADRDLILLHEDPRYIEMVTTYEQAFRQEFEARSLYLDEGYLSEIIQLLPNNPETTSTQIGTPEVSAFFDSDNLKINLSVKDSSYNDQSPLHNSGSGVIVNLVLPISPDDYETSRYFSFGFSCKNGIPEATLLSRHGVVLLQTMPEIAPQIKATDGNIAYQISIPWKLFTPYAPPLDQEMGLNIFYVGATVGSGTSRSIFALMPENKLAFEAYPWRRFVPAIFLTSDRSKPLLQGRLYERLCESVNVGFQLALWSNSVGHANCHISIHPQNQQCQTVGEETIENWECETEINFFDHTVDITNLPAGSYFLKVVLTGPDGITFTQKYPFDNFEQSWIASLNERIYKIDSVESSILNYHLFSLTRKIETRHPQDDASALHKTYENVVRLIRMCESGASCLPESGLFVGGFTSAVMTQRSCVMYLPKGYESFQDPHLLIVLPPEPGSENKLAYYLGQALEGKKDAIVLVPQSNGFSSLATNKSAGQTILAIEWAQDLFDAPAVTLVGLGTGADAALETSLRQPDLCRNILLDGRFLYRDLGSFSESTLQEKLGARTNSLPYTFLSGKQPTERLTITNQTMTTLGYTTKIQQADLSRQISHLLAEWFLNQ